jgi:ABC-type multidrug transport system fused ATPase/permease subunit
MTQLIPRDFRLLLTIFLRSARKHPTFPLLFIPVALTLSALWVGEPLYGRYAIDRLLLLTESGDAPLLEVMAGWLGIYMLINVFQGCSHYIKWAIQHDLLAETRETYYEHALQLDISHHVRARGGEVMKKIDNAADTVVDVVRQIFLDFIPTALTSLTFFLISFWISWQLALITLAVLPVYVIILYFYVRSTRKNWDKVTALWVKSLGRAYDAITNIFTIKSVASEEREVETMRAVHREGIRELRRVNVLWSLLEGIGYFMLMRIMLIGIGIYLYTQGELSLGSVFFFQFSFFRVVVPLEMLGGMMPRWSEKISKIQMAEDLYLQEIVVKNRPEAKTLPELRGQIHFEDVSFSYGGIDAIHHLSLDVTPGEHIAFVGHSGAGKSTLAMLINRFYDVTEGRITIDGIDMRDLDLSWWRSQIGLVLQENITFNDTIKENIRYARPDATDTEIIEAAKRASAHDFIDRLPGKYDTMVGERGIRLSGGERQRVAIARAILKRPKIVVLDEATSALDSITERQVQEGIKELIEGRTSFIIAHRLSTVRAVDRIAVLDQGRIIACAPHEELMQTCDVYQEMVRLQHYGLLAEDGLPVMEEE